MNGNKLFSDINVIINHPGGNHQAEMVLDDCLIYISSITLTELLASPALTSDEEKVLKEYLKSLYIIHTNDFICEWAAALRRTVKIKLPDAIIAATSIFLDVPLVTFDTDFDKIEI